LGQEKFAGKLAASLPRKRKNQTESYEANYTETEEAKLQRNGRTEEGLGARFGARLGQARSPASGRIWLGKRITPMSGNLTR
jgi:hypothetical protein